MGDKKDLKTEIRGFAEHIQSLSDDELEKAVGGIGGAHESSDRTDAITKMIRDYVNSVA